MTEEEQEHLAELSKQGYQFLRENMNDEARDKFLEILATDPANNYALVGLGDLERKERNYDAAIEHYQRCLNDHPDNSYALFGLGESYRATRQYNLATEIWERYLRHDDKNVTVLTRVADAHRKARKFERSRELYHRVLEVEPGNAYALIGLGHLFYDFKDYQSAKYYWQQMYESAGDAVDIRVLTSLGNCHRKLKSFEQGIPYFEQAIAREPDNFYALYGLADCYRGLQQPEKSLEVWLHILRIDPENKVILTRIGDAYRAMGDRDHAESYYRHALELEYDTYAALGLAIIHRERGEYDAATTALEELAASDTDNARAFLELAGCYEDQRKIPEALAILSRYLQNARHPGKNVQRKIAELRDQLG